MTASGEHRAPGALALGCATVLAGCALWYSATTEYGWITTLLAVAFTALLVAFLCRWLPDPMWSGGP